ncbi:hypothetical protein DFJ73DRAFT_777328 [Zopfochytrium polystomum]|nr:hypothetical protein DFJ73DRAFT_777328 [Zopfochytrium polystomum]
MAAAIISFRHLLFLAPPFSLFSNNSKQQRLQSPLVVPSQSSFSFSSSSSAWVSSDPKRGLKTSPPDRLRGKRCLRPTAAAEATPSPPSLCLTSITLSTSSFPPSSYSSSAPFSSSVAPRILPVAIGCPRTTLLHTPLPNVSLLILLPKAPPPPATSSSYARDTAASPPQPAGICGSVTNSSSSCDPAQPPRPPQRPPTTTALFPKQTHIQQPSPFPPAALSSDSRYSTKNDPRNVSSSSSSSSSSGTAKTTSLQVRIEPVLPCNAGGLSACDGARPADPANVVTVESAVLAAAAAAAVGRKRARPEVPERDDADEAQGEQGEMTALLEPGANGWWVAVRRARMNRQGGRERVAPRHGIRGAPVAGSRAARKPADKEIVLSACNRNRNSKSINSTDIHNNNYNNNAHRVRTAGACRARRPGNDPRAAAHPQPRGGAAVPRAAVEAVKALEQRVETLKGQRDGFLARVAALEAERRERAATERECVERISWRWERGF